MRTTTPTKRTTPRIILEEPIPGTLGDQTCIILELGLGGAKLEHGKRIALGDDLLLRIDSGQFRVRPKYSVALPGHNGIVYHSGVAFEKLSHADEATIHKLLLEEAESQVSAWEANLEGKLPGAHPTVRSSVAPRFIWMRLTRTGWQRTDTTDPNQPIDGFAIPAEITEDEIKTLCKSYEMSDDATREALRRVAMLAVVERLGNR